MVNTSNGWSESNKYNHNQITAWQASQSENNEPISYRFYQCNEFRYDVPPGTYVLMLFVIGFGVNDITEECSRGDKSRVLGIYFENIHIKYILLKTRRCVYWVIGEAFRVPCIVQEQREHVHTYFPLQLKQCNVWFIRTISRSSGVVLGCIDYFTSTFIKASDTKLIFSWVRFISLKPDVN